LNPASHYRRIAAKVSCWFDTADAYSDALRAFAAEWLRELLREPRWVEDILRLAAKNNIAFTTLKRAKKSIGAKSVKIGGYFGGEDTRWFWRLG
jgi:hypothetical protein